MWITIRCLHPSSILFLYIIHYVTRFGNLKIWIWNTRISVLRLFEYRLTSSNSIILSIVFWVSTRYNVWMVRCLKKCILPVSITWGALYVVCIILLLIITYIYILTCVWRANGWLKELCALLLRYYNNNIS